MFCVFFSVVVSVSRSRREVEEDQKDLDDEFFDVEEAVGTTATTVDAAFTSATEALVTMQDLVEPSSSSQTKIVRRTELPKPRTEFNKV